MPLAWKAMKFSLPIALTPWPARVLIAIALLIILSPMAVLAQAAEDRIAFIIGNGGYPKDLALKNPLNDASAIEKQLSGFGFEIKSYKDLKVAQVSGLRQQMESRIKRNSVLFFYYAGHGVQIDGRNYLVPVDATLSDGDKASQESFYLGDVLHAIERMRPKIAVVILDSCRDNPFKNQKNSSTLKQGLARVDPPTSTVVFYATRPGGTAQDGEEENGVFTKALLQEIAKPQQPLEVMFRKVSTSVYKSTKGEQEPWVEGVIREEVILAQQVAQPSLTVAALSPNLPLESFKKPIAEAVSSTAAELSTSLSINTDILDTPKPSPTLPPILVAQAQAIRSLTSLDMKAETLNTKFYCEDGNCADYEALYRDMRDQKKFPELFSPFQKFELCEFDLHANACKEDFLNHGRGVSPFLPIQALFGTRLVTKNLVLNQVKPTNGGGISFFAEPTVRTERTNIGIGNTNKCSQNPGRIELMRNQLELEISSSVCISVTPPIPSSYKLSTDVLAYDHTNRDFYVRWRVTKYSVGYYSSTAGIAKLSLR